MADWDKDINVCQLYFNVTFRVKDQIFGSFHKLCNFTDHSFLRSVLIRWYLEFILVQID
jgi:hypothetical protein